MRHVLFHSFTLCIIASNYNNRTLSLCQACQFKRFFFSGLSFQRYISVLCVCVCVCLWKMLQYYMETPYLHTMNKEWKKKEHLKKSIVVVLCRDKSTRFQYCYVHHTLHIFYFFFSYTYISTTDICFKDYYIVVMNCSP